jgi:hypothetical protein
MVGACFMALAGCGSVTATEAKVNAGLRELEQQARAPHNGWTGYFPRPKGVSRSEWWAAIAADRNLPSFTRRFYVEMEQCLHHLGPSMSLQSCGDWQRSHPASGSAP